MKLLKVLAIVLMVAVMGTSALAAANLEDMKDGIVFEIATGKYPHQMATLYCDDYSLDEWKLAAVAAVEEAREKGYIMTFDWEGYLDGSFFESQEFFDSLEAQDIDREWYIPLSWMVPAENEGDLGDESIPMYVLCGLVAVALGGAVVARRKRLAA